MLQGGILAVKFNWIVISLNNSDEVVANTNETDKEELSCGKEWIYEKHNMKMKKTAYDLRYRPSPQIKSATHQPTLDKYLSNRSQ